jgi:dihydrofolate reductase
MSVVFSALAASADGFITEVFDAASARTGAVIIGRTTYDHSNGWEGGGPHPTAPPLILSHRPPPARLAAARQTFVSTGIEDAIAQARRVVAAPGVTHLTFGIRR